MKAGMKSWGQRIQAQATQWQNRDWREDLPRTNYLDIEKPTKTRKRTSGGNFTSNWKKAQ